jgi:catechol 2,3-dioxygenase-like lactoylglutathione lyase family enzyme
MSDQDSADKTIRETAFRNMVQIGVVVRDLDRTVQFLSEILGLGPFRYITYPPDREDMATTYRGEPGAYSHRIAFTELGPIELEIVQPLTGESALTEFLEEHGEGIQHIRFNVDDLQPVLDYVETHGITVLMSGTGLRPGTTWVHLDTADKTGFVIELMNVLPGTSGRTPQQLEP